MIWQNVPVQCELGKRSGLPRSYSAYPSACVPDWRASSNTIARLATCIGPRSSPSVLTVAGCITPHKTFRTKLFKKWRMVYAIRFPGYYLVDFSTEFKQTMAVPFVPSSKCQRRFSASASPCSNGCAAPAAACAWVTSTASTAAPHF